MKLVFWQNIISPHQVDFLKEISKFYETVLVVEQIQDKYRLQDKWEIPDYSFFKLIISPSKNEIHELFQNKETIHLFSGISAYKTVFTAFKIAVKQKAKIGIISEPINLKVFKGMVKWIRGNYQRFKYNRKINFIAATGNLGINTYVRFGYPEKKLFQWGYFVYDKTNLSSTTKNKDVIYVGQLIDRKQIVPFAKLFTENNGFGFNKLKILGIGNLEHELNVLQDKYPTKIELMGRQSSHTVYQLISESSLLVLPSKFDGWGVVVNEALMCGTPVLASSEVGANVLLNGNKGCIFKAGDMDDLKNKIKNWSEKELYENDYKEIKGWAEKAISPAAAANYFNEIIEYVYSGKTKKPMAPWVIYRSSPKQKMDKNDFN